MPISRFNKGHANKIFSEVHEEGYKILIKNNKPICVLITPDEYERMIVDIEKYNQLVDADTLIINEKKAEFFATTDIKSKFIKG